MKKRLCFLLIFTILLTAIPLGIIVDAATDDYREIIWGDYGDKYKHYEKPEAGFSLSCSGQTVVSDSGMELNIKLGDTITISDLSSVGSGTAINGYDWQVYGDTSVGKVTVANGVLSSLPSSIKLQYTGTYDFYLCVKDNQKNMPSDGQTTWQNWSDNGSHGSYGTSSTGKKMWWYFVHVRVNVTSDKPIADMEFSDTSNTTKNIYLGESFTLEDKSYAMTDGATIVGWSVKAGSNPQTYITNPDSFFTTYTPSYTGTYKYTLYYVYDSNNAKSENPAKTLTVIVSQRPQPGQGKVIYEHYKDSVSPDNLLGTNEVGISNPYTVVLPDTYGDNLGFKSATYSGGAVSAGGSCKNGTNITITDTTKDLIIQAIYKAGSTGPSNYPPTAIIDAPEWVYAGEDFHISGKRSYDSDGSISSYQWQYDNEYTGCTLSDKKEGYIWFDYENNGRIDLTVKDNQGATDSARHYVEILPPIPVAKITPTGILKENRKVNISAGSSWSPRHYPIDHSRNEWKFNIPDMRYKGIFSGRDKDVLFKQAGKKEFNLKVWNTYSDPTVPNGFSGELTDDFIIQPDLEPIADFSIPSVVLRDPKDSNKATIVITNTSRSTDNDIIGKTVMFYAYDSNNDNNFDNETWYYSLDGTAWQPVGLPYNQIKTGFDIYSRGTGNPAKFELVVDRTSVGKYKFEAMTIEDIPDDETIKEFLSPNDYKRSDTFSSKLESEKICDVRNVAPTIDFEIKKIIPMDLVVVTDYAQSDYDNLQAAIDVFKSQVLPLDVEPKIHIVNDNKENVGERKVDKYIWNRYIKININGPAYNLYYTFHFNTDVKINLESLEFFEAEEEFPDRSKYSYTINTWWIGDYENSSGSMKYYYINVDYSIYYNGQFQRMENKEIVFAQGQNFNGLGTFFNDTDKLNVTFNTTTYSRTFTKADEPSGSEKRPFSSINIDRIKSLDIDGDSNKYILFAVENFYNIAEVDTALSEYLQLNNYGIYIVADDKVINKAAMMGPWDDIYYVVGEKSYLSGNKLYKYKDNELTEVDYASRSIPSSVSSVTVELHEYRVRYSRTKDESWRTYVDVDNRYNTTISIINGSITVNSTTLNNVKCMYKAGDFYFVELNNGDVYYFSRRLNYGGNLNQYYILYITDLVKIPDAKGIKDIKLRQYKDYTFETSSYDNSPVFLDTTKVSMIDTKGNLYEGKMSNVHSRTNYSELDYHYPTPTAVTGISKTKSNLSDFYLRVVNKQGSYYDPWSQKQTFNYQVVENDYIELPELNIKIKSNLDVDMFGDRDYISLAKLISGSLKGNAYGAKDYQKALDDIIADITGIKGISSSYLLLNEKIKYEIQYSDYETDQENQRLWRYIHDPYYFENSMGLDSNSSKNITEPLTSFSKVGKFEASLKTQDKPKDNTLFMDYWMWSAEKKANIYVHRKPIALIKLDITPNGGLFKIEAVDGGSYDLDHESRADKGIIAREWKWKELYDDTWKNERLNKLDCSDDMTYQVALRVKDLEGVWSDWTIETVDNKQPPTAKFEILKNPITNLELPQIIDTSYAIMSNLTNWHWIVKKINDNGSVGATLQDVKATVSNTGTGGYDTTLNITRTNPGVGRYRIYLRVKADNGLWSDGGTDAAPVISNMFYRDLTVNQALSIEDISLAGRWNHFRGWTDKFGVWKDVMKDVTYVDEKGINKYPYRFLSYEKIDITIKLEGYADKLIIDFPDGLNRMTYTDKLGYTYSYREDVGYTVSFPYEIEIDPTLKDPVISWSYILPLVDSTASWENTRLKQPYTIRIKAIKGSYEVIQDKKIDITGNVDDLIFIQPVAR